MAVRSWVSQCYQDPSDLGFACLFVWPLKHHARVRDQTRRKQASTHKRASFLAALRAKNEHILSFLHSVHTQSTGR